MNSQNHDEFYDRAAAAGRPQPSLNVHLSVPPGDSNAMAGDGSHTPNTPEILNSILSLQQDLIAGYQGPLPSIGHEPSGPSHLREMDTIPMVPPLHDGTSLSSMVSHPSHSQGLMTSDGGVTMSVTSGAPPSVQHFRSQFIKEGLKIKVQQNLGAGRGRHTSEESIASTSVSSPANPATPNSEGVAIKSEELTEEDEIRRQRRRERNKVAATKCRNKKKQRTQLLVKESEVLVEQNRHLKTEITKLEVEKKRLMDVLSLHQPSCAKRLRSSEADPDPHLLGDLEQGSHHAQHPPLSVLPGHSSGYQGFHDDQNAANSAASFAQSQNPDDGTSRYYSDDRDMGSFHFSTDIKTEDSGSQLDMAFLQATCGTNYSATNPTSTSPSSGPFLVKRHVPNLYLDMDSRCIAL
ncbi:activating transcription factor 3-like isoform X2 [Tigriopus californicus]|nr:activating transcription factor 3-like isoform X2 [Tigriopus californicus]